MKRSGLAVSDTAKVVSGGDAITRLTESARRNELVAVVGSGVSVALTNGKLPALSWKGLIRDGFAHSVKKGRINAKQAATWKTLLNSEDLDDLLGAAEFVGRKLDAPHGDLYARWLENVFDSVRPSSKKLESALRALHTAGVPFCTLNYDHLLERAIGLPVIKLNEINKVAAWMRRENDSVGVLHLHGSWDDPSTCILGIRDYATTLGNDVRDLFQRSLTSFRRLLFIGCGDTFADPNFSALIKWLRESMKTAAPEHYALVTNGEMADRHADATWHGFVEPLGYGAHHGDLPAFLLKHFPAPTAMAAKNKGGPVKAPASNSKHARLLQDYRAFLLKDCGQMTIEGVRADMDTAQRKFELERLFVPLQVLPCPPEIPEKDPQREQKLIEWKEKNKEPLPFGRVFATHKCLALLALPGGGKTLLLKRLAVAYADSARRLASEDALPDLDLIPVLIRCREWREHVGRPILTLLRNIPDITGQAHLTGLREALLPLFRKGRILLLVDGLDEIHNDALRSTFVDNLDAFLGEYNQTHLVVTSREAGFSLVAPTLARFCERWHVAPLQADAIAALCDHWHRLMTGDSPEALAEGQEVAYQLLENQSLRRLAENPLLLTMLLVVKHGAGRLPPDRVSLYGRAVEVLLDTWNIKGHESLNPKEAVPQLAYVAFQLMRTGKQTATGEELLFLLKQARENVPQIGRYAKDTPDEFLKRVELRSSLLVEAGHQKEGSRTVPFYQFRHLTFQEYLAAVAAVEGHYESYQKSDTVLTPLAPYLTAEEWKEVIPMSAVLARKQAEPLMAALVEEGNQMRRKAEAGEVLREAEVTWNVSQYVGEVLAPTPAAARLVQCLAEEAEAAPETLIAALQLAAFFGNTERTGLAAISRGPYGREMLHQAWLLYASMQWPFSSRISKTCGFLAPFRHPITYWEGSEGQAELQGLLSSKTAEEIARGLFTCYALKRVPELQHINEFKSIVPLTMVEQHLFQDDPALWAAATFALGAARQRPQPSPVILDRLLNLWLRDEHRFAVTSAAFTLSRYAGLRRNAWRPVLTEAQLQRIRQVQGKGRTEEEQFVLLASYMVAFHAGNVWPEAELAERLVAATETPVPDSNRRALKTMLRQMGEAGAKRRKRRP